jgi:hypothetical protein
MLEFDSAKFANAIRGTAEFTLLFGEPRVLSEDVATATHDRIIGWAVTFESAGLPHPAQRLRAGAHLFRAGAVTNEHRELLLGVRDRLNEDLSNVLFFRMDNCEVKYLHAGGSIFAAVLSSRYKDAIPELERASDCMAKGEPTAAVFHLMRAMELVIRRLGRRFGFKLTPQTTWRKITNNMDHHIAAMPNKTVAQAQAREAWEAARANLHAVGSVWRNTTMHPARSYTHGQAADVLAACRSFLIEVCRLQSPAYAKQRA